MIHIQEEIKVTKIYLVTNCFGDSNKVYIGKEKSHKKQSRKADHKLTYGEKIEFDFIDQCKGWNYKDWESLETFWIQYFKFLGFEVMNKRKKGGSGPEICSEIHRERISKSLKGKKRPKEFGIKMREKLKGKPKPKRTKEHCEKLSNSHLGKKHSIETIKKFIGRRKGISAFPTKPLLQFDLNNILIKEWSGIPEASKILNITASGINACCLGKQKTAFGFIWKYK